MSVTSDRIDAERWRAKAREWKQACEVEHQARLLHQHELDEANAEIRRHHELITTLKTACEQLYRSYLLTMASEYDYQSSTWWDREGREEIGWIRELLNREVG